MWLLKIFIKIIISRFNISYEIWKSLNIFKHGEMESFEYSRKIFEGHYKDMKNIKEIHNPVIMEIGPGDSLFSMIYSRKYTSEKLYFLDVDSFASKDCKLYYELQKKLEQENYFTYKREKSFPSFDEVLRFYNAKYLISGLKSLKNINSNSIDYIFSHSVMEHIRKNDLKDFIKEMFRVLKPSGVISHNINYKDHLAESLNNLRFSERLWESKLFANSGFYTNRVPAIEMHRIFRENGFNLVYENFGKWNKLPLRRNKINKIFNNFSDKELSIPTSSFLAIK
tara:strand:+ start:1097 stop:1942 length:846 start_codon:yes stop_codon:yes gene_type:complete